MRKIRHAPATALVTTLATTSASALMAFTLFATAPAHAAEYVQQRLITAMGCHHVDGTCYVTLDGAPFGGSEGCPSGAHNEFRWDNADTANGRRTHASMFAAFLQNKRVSVFISGCGQQGGPTLTYYTIHQ